MEAHATITLTMTRTEAAVIRLALALLVQDRMNAPDEANRYLPEDKRAGYIADAAETQAHAEQLSETISCALRPYETSPTKLPIP